MTIVLIKRLREYINPFFHLGWEWDDKPSIDDFSCDPVLFLHGIDRPINPRGRWETGTPYDYGRIAFFIEQIKHGLSVEPIEIDNKCSGGSILPIAILVDGCHRFAAHIVLNKEKIKICYGGRMDVLSYLKGETDKCPSE